MTVHPLPPDGPTELVEADSGELVERLSGGTATILLIWLIGVGAGTALLAVWLLAVVLFDEKFGLDELFSGFGFYVALYGAIGPTVLWLTGRAQEHGAGWFVWTAERIGLLMAGITVVFGAMVFLMLGYGISSGALAIAAAIVGATAVVAIAWGLATWAADRWIAAARSAVEPNR
jgi:hypothetical protein